jgi:hypothetical protein
VHRGQWEVPCWVRDVCSTDLTSSRLHPKDWHPSRNLPHGPSRTCPQPNLIHSGVTQGHSCPNTQRITLTRFLRVQQQQLPTLHTSLLSWGRLLWHDDHGHVNVRVQERLETLVIQYRYEIEWRRRLISVILLVNLSVQKY